MPAVTPPINHDRSSTARIRRPGWPLWAWAALAVGLGLIIAAVLILRGRGDYDFYRADGVAPSSAGPGFAPLPVPGDKPPEVSSADSMPSSLGDILAGGSSNDGAFVIDDPAPVAPPPRAPEPTAPVVPSPATAPAPAQTAAQTFPVPLPNNPAPDYPGDAYRNGETGKVNVRVSVDAQGNATDARVELTSRSRSLDRAAVNAVRGWRFRPATRNGQPVASDAIVTVEFKLP